MFEQLNLDVDLLGLQHELLGWLSENGIVWFEDFERVEADLGNGELKVYLICDFAHVADAIRTFAERNNFPRIFYSPEKGAVTLRRR
jgi:hypothetical protein